MGLLLSICVLSLNCYPDKLEYIDLVFGMAKDAIIAAQIDDEYDLP